MEELETDKRKYAAVLIFKVLAKSLLVREALLHFPKNTEDKSVFCAYHALIHLEADEDLRMNDKEYAKEQDKYLETIALILYDSKPLPLNIINEYNKYYKEAPPIFSNDKKGIIKSLFRFLNI